jgi:hypothetical protein
MTTNTQRLRAYNRAVQGWIAGKLDEDDIDLLVRTRWITKEQGDEIKLLPRGDQQAADVLMQKYQSDLSRL